MKPRFVFDELAKGLCSGFSRRDALKNTVRLALRVICTSIGLTWLGTRPSLADVAAAEDLVTLMKDRTWTCRSVALIRLDQDSNGATDPYPALCIHSVHCSRPTKSRQFVAACKARGKSCLAFQQCAEEFNDKKEVAMTAGRPSPEPAKPANVSRFGGRCRYGWGKPYVIYRKHPTKPADTDDWDTICASPMEGCAVPAPIKGSFLATCKTVGEIKVEGATYMLCPSVQDCLAKPTPVVSNPPMVDDSKPTNTS